MVNKVILVGNLGMAIECRVFEGGGKVAKTSLATSESWKDKATGEKKQVTTWHNLTFHGPLADLAEKYLVKGSKIYVEGKIVNRSWEKEGVKHYMTEISVREMRFLGDGQTGNAAAPKEEFKPVGDQSEPDDLPF